MPRKLGLEHPEAIYHVMSRVNGKRNIFETDLGGECRGPGNLIIRVIPD
jgi:hypothetical protein